MIETLFPVMTGHHVDVRSCTPVTPASPISTTNAPKPPKRRRSRTPHPNPGKAANDTPDCGAAVSARTVRGLTREWRDPRQMGRYPRAIVARAWEASPGRRSRD
jgi:hypothetical protein